MAVEDLGGYDYQFVDPGPTDEQKCPICHLIVKDAHQVTCCGKMFCKNCIDRCTQQNNSCPHCRLSYGTSYFKDVRGEREIKSLKVFCKHHNSGCDWIGELRDVEQHMDNDCLYKMIDCPQGCGEQKIRSQIRNHCVNRCPLRRHICQLCGKKGTHRFIIGDHQRQCPKVKVACPNQGCTVRVERQDSTRHEKVCPKQLVKCPFASFGCLFHDCLELLPQHTEKEVQLHMEKIAQRMEKQSEDQSKEMEKQANKIATFERIANESKRLFENVDRFTPITVKLAGYKSHKQDNKSWYSNGFYTGPGGYKVRLRVDPNGCGEGKSTHVSVYINLMPGEHDDNLEFPMRGNFNIILLNQLQNAGHHTMTICFTGNDDGASNRKYQVKDSGGYGFTKFIEQSRLEPFFNCQYLMHDTVYFKIEALYFTSMGKPWLLT